MPASALRFTAKAKARLPKQDGLFSQPRSNLPVTAATTVGAAASAAMETAAEAATCVAAAKSAADV
ncbi:MAG: hypothetical protein WCC26_08110, partial [Terracidiphilus sp.]